MPVLHFPLSRLQRVLGKETAPETLLEQLPLFGVPVEGLEDGELSVEIFPDRPDLLSAELLGRALRAYLEIEPGLPGYEVAAPAAELTVDPSVAPVRPVIVCGAAHGLDLDEEGVKALMDLQEDLHWGLGARRRKVSVGIHDARGIEPPYTYKAVDPDSVSFVPLHDTREMTMREMVDGGIEKGEEYASLVEAHDRWPLIVDADDQVLSFPPIINGTVTTLRPGTTDVLVDVTGTDPRACRQVLNVVMSHLAECGGSLEQVRLATPEGELVTPDLEPETQALDLKLARSLLGVELDAEAAAAALARMGHGARVDGDEVLVEIGPWRADVLHPVDLVEDVGIGLGYDRFQGTGPRAVTYGRALPRQRFAEQVRRALTGLGYLECMTLTLTSLREQQEMIGAEDPVVTVQNPESSEQAVARRRLLPALLTLAGRNTHRDLPQRLFEVGEVLEPDGDQRPVNRSRVAGLEVASDAGFTRIKAHVEALLRTLGYRFQEEATSAPGFVAGRAAVVVDPESGRELGHYGEIAPAVIDRFELGTPCAGFELELLDPPAAETWSPEEEREHALELRGAS